VALDRHKTDAFRRQTLGARLLDPKHGDVIIRFPETIQTNSEEKALFAESEILCAFSAYFKNCTATSCIVLLFVFHLLRGN